MKPFGGCDCSLGLVECQCVQACRKAELDDLPLTRSDWTLATVIVACCAIPILFGPMMMEFFVPRFS